MVDHDNRYGIAPPTFGRILFSPESEPAGGVNDPAPDPAGAARRELDASLGPQDGGAGATPKTGSENSRTPAPAPAAPAPAAGAPRVRTVEELQKELDDYRGGEPQRTREAQNAALMEFAQRSPENWKLITGEDPPPGMFPDAGGPAKPPDPAAPADPNADLRKRLETIEAGQRRAADEKRVTEIRSQVFDEFDKYDDVFGDKSSLSSFAQEAAGNAVLRAMSGGRNADIARIVKGVAEAIRKEREAQKTEYLNGKRETAERIPAGVGAGTGPAQGKGPQKLKPGKGPGTYRDVLERELREANRGAKDDE